MKPYEVEIFDRNFNFRANALINPESFKWQRDLLTTVSNTLTLLDSSITIRTDASSGSAGDNTVALSDYIRIINADNDDFVGVVKKLDKEDRDLIITYTSITALFNLDIYINSIEIIRTPIETYIKDRLLEAFKNNSDTYQNITGLEVETHTLTYGIFDFIDTSDPYVVINILNDLIYPAFNKYVITVQTTFDIANKKIKVDIGRMSTASLMTIESDFPNIIDKNVIIRSTSNEIIKLTIIDESASPYNSYTYYLKTDYTYDTTASTNRMLPVVNTIQAVDIDNLAEHSYWTYEKAYVPLASSFVEVDRTLNNTEVNQLYNSLTLLQAFIHANRYTSTYNFYFTMLREYASWIIQNKAPFSSNTYHYFRDDDGSNIYDDLQEKGEGYYTFTYIIHTAPNYRYYQVSAEGSGGDYYIFSGGTFPDQTGYISDPIDGQASFGIFSHAGIRQDIEVRLYVNLIGKGNVPSVYTIHLISWSGASQLEYDTALDDYKQSPTYQTDLATYKANNLNQILADYADNVFKTSKYKNLIELTLMESDPIVSAVRWGRTVTIIHKGTSYASLLTGITVLGNGLVKLTFGMIRLELTKILKMKGG